MAASAKDCRIAVGFASHPKIVKLRRRLGADGVLSLIALWAWTAGNKPSGDLARISDEDLEICAGWPGAAGGLIRELTDLRLLDGDAGERTIHDWAAHNGWAAGADRRSEAARQAALAKHRGNSAGRSEYPAARTAESEIVPADSSAPHAEPAKTACPVSASISVSASVSETITETAALPSLFGDEQLSPPADPVDRKAQLFDIGVKVLAVQNPKSNPRPFLGMLIRDSGEQRVLEALEHLQRENPVDAAAWLKARCGGKKGTAPAHMRITATAAEYLE